MTSLGGIVSIFSEIKKYEEDTLFAGKAVEQMTKAFGNMNVDDAIKAFRGLGIEGEDLVEILLDCGVKSEVVEASLKKVGKTGTTLKLQALAEALVLLVLLVRLALLQRKSLSSKKITRLISINLLWKKRATIIGMPSFFAQKKRGSRMGAPLTIHILA